MSSELGRHKNRHALWTKESFFFLLVLFLIALPLGIKLKSKARSLIEDLDRPLIGAIIPPAKPSISMKSLLDGTFQNNYEVYYAYKLSGRELMTRLYNQILFSVFKSTDNATMQIGGNKYLFEQAYVQAYFTEVSTGQKDELTQKIKMLNTLKTRLTEKGKVLAVIITPSKVSIYPEYLPACYYPYVHMKNSGNYENNFYDAFIETCAELNFDFLDLHKKFLSEKENDKIIFTVSGIHWTAGTAMSYFLPAFTEYLNTKLTAPLGSIITKEENLLRNNPFRSDGDLEVLLNLAMPRYNFYSSHTELSSFPSSYRPAVFVCGGSFSWNWVDSIFGNHVKGEALFSKLYVSYYNSYITRYPGNDKIADTTNDFASIMENDIIVIELNEQAINPNASHFVFVENLLKYLDEIDDLGSSRG